jgi:RecA/RadA recombinase
MAKKEATYENPLLNALRLNDAAKGKKAKGYYENDTNIISYKTGFPTLDYRLGHRVYVTDEKGEKTSYLNLGITSGSYVCLVGKPGGAKTSMAIQIAGNITRPFESGMVIHIDCEGATDYTRVQSLTKITLNILRDKYKIRQTKISLADFKSMIVDVYREKVNNKEKYEYDTGKKNVFGEEIIMLQPTVFLLDSFATMSSGIEDKTIEELNDVMSQTERMRLTGEIGRFLNEILPILKEANIILIAVNQIKTNPGMGIIKAPGMVLGLRPDEAPAAGWAPLFNAQILIRCTGMSSDKFTIEDDGFTGFGVKLDIIKSRVSAAGESCVLVFNRNTGISPIRSSVYLAKEIGMLEGNRAHYHFKGYTTTFSQKTMEEDFIEKPELIKEMKEVIDPVLKSYIGNTYQEEINNNIIYDLYDD